MNLTCPNPKCGAVINSAESTGYCERCYSPIDLPRSAPCKNFFLAGAAIVAVLLYICACILPVATSYAPATGRPNGTYPGIMALLFGWMSFDKPLLILAWFSNFPWLAALIGFFACGSKSWVRYCALAGIAGASFAILTDEEAFRGRPARYYWFASFMFLGAACWASRLSVIIFANDTPTTEPDRVTGP